MTTPYVDPQTIHNPATGTSPPAAWGDALRDGLEFLVRQPGCKMETATAQTTVSSNWYNISWNAAVDLRDTDGYHSGTGDTIVVPAGFGGWYAIAGSIVFEANGVGVRMVRYSINGAGDYRLAVIPTAGAAVGTRVPFAEDVLLSAGDILRISSWQNSGGNLQVLEGSKVNVRLVALP